MGAQAWGLPVTVFPPHFDNEVRSSFHHTSRGEEDPKVHLHPRGPHMSAGSFSATLSSVAQHEHS